MNYTFASLRKVSFIVSVGGRNLLVAFGDRNAAGVSAFMTNDDKVAKAIRRHSLTRRGIIEETTKEKAEETKPATPVKEAEAPKTDVAPPTETATKKVRKPAKKTAKEISVPGACEEREYDNYTIARERICKEFGINKSEVRNPTALARVAQEHGIIIKYKEL